MPHNATLRATGTVSQSNGKYRLVLEVHSASLRGERTLQASSCDELATSAAVIIAMSATLTDKGPPIYRGSSVSPPVAPPIPQPTPLAAAAPLAAPAPAAPQPTTTTPTVTPLADRAPTSPPSTKKARVGGPTFRPEFTVDGGTLPAIGFGGGGAIGFDFRTRFHLEAHLGAFASRDGTLPNDPSRGGAFLLIAGGVRGCFAITRIFEIASCLGIGVSQLSASGFGTSKTTTEASTMFVPEGGVRLFAPINRRFGLSAGAFVTVPVGRQPFVIEARGAVHEPAPIGFRSYFGPEVRF